MPLKLKPCALAMEQPRQTPEPGPVWSQKSSSLQLWQAVEAREPPLSSPSRYRRPPNSDPKCRPAAVASGGGVGAAAGDGAPARVAAPLAAHAAGPAAGPAPRDQIQAGHGPAAVAPRRPVRHGPPLPLAPCAQPPMTHHVQLYLLDNVCKRRCIHDTALLSAWHHVRALLRNPLSPLAGFGQSTDIGP